MLCGNPPFYGKSEEKSMDYNFDFPAFSKVSEEARDLIRKIFVDSDRRPSISDILDSTWVKENVPNASSESLNINWIKIMKNSKLNLLQKSIVNFRAFHMTITEAREFTEVFKLINENSDGVLTLEEIKKGINHCKCSFQINENEVDQLSSDMDVDKNGLVNYTGFVSALIDYEKKY